MNIWKKNLTLTQMNQLSKSSAIEHLGIEFIEQGDNWLTAKMPVDSRTTQPSGLLHGGISAALAESVASMAGFCCVDDNQGVVGVDLNATHIKAVRAGYVFAKACVNHLGKRLQMWQVTISNQDGDICCQARLTVAVVSL